MIKEQMFYQNFAMIIVEIWRPPTKVAWLKYLVTMDLMLHSERMMELSM